MKLVDSFNRALSMWFAKHGMPNIHFVEGEEFCYYPEWHAVQWGIFMNNEQENMFAQFMYEYGLKENINPFVISLLHEVGHYMTLHQFNEVDVNLDHAAKQVAAGAANGITIDTHYWYWELPTEFAANMWAIEWANTHPTELQELHHFCEERITEMFNKPEIVAQVMGWKLKMELGEEYEPLCIDEED